MSGLNSGERIVVEGHERPRRRHTREGALMETLVKVRDLHKVYYRGSEQIDVLQGMTIDIPSGDFLALMGPSGSGKTTLLNLIGGLDTPTKGSIDVAGDRIDTLAGGKLASWRARHIGFVFQMYNLLPVLTAARNVELPLLLTKLAIRGPQEARADRVVGRGARRAGQPLSAPALGRSGTARRHRPRDRHRSDAAALRRADGRSRSQVRRRSAQPAARRSTATTARRSSW